MFKVSHTVMSLLSRAVYTRIQCGFILMVEKFPLFYSQGVFPRIPGRDMYYPSDIIDRVGQLLDDSHGCLSLEDINEIFLKYASKLSWYC